MTVLKKKVIKGFKILLVPILAISSVMLIPLVFTSNATSQESIKILSFPVVKAQNLEDKNNQSLDDVFLKYINYFFKEIKSLEENKKVLVYYYDDNKEVLTIRVNEFFEINQNNFNNNKYYSYKFIINN